MAEEKEKTDVKEEGTEEKTGLAFNNKEELTSFLTELQGQIGTMQETIDKLSPSKEEGTEEKEEETGEELSKDEVSDIDAMLQGN